MNGGTEMDMSLRDAALSGAAEVVPVFPKNKAS
jgi:hypothetical protein